MRRFLFLAGMMILSVPLFGADIVGSQPDVQLYSEKMMGVTLYPDGETPIIDLPVRVWSVDKEKMVYKTRTDKDGCFSIPPLAVGRCYIFVGRVKVDMSVLKYKSDTVVQQHDLVVIMPRGLLMVSSPQIMDIWWMAPSLIPFVEPPPQPKVVSP